MEQHVYLAIDAKAFFASVECVARGLDPLTTNLVVADESRTEKTICLAVSPALKAYGISGRARLFEVVQKVREVNALRRSRAPGRNLTGKSCDARELASSPSLAVSYIVAPPRMARYVQCSATIYQTYLKYVAPSDIMSYSIDEVFIDITKYLKLYNLTAHELAMKMIRDVLDTTGITATAGIAPNLYLCKVAMDIVAKHIEPDEDGVRIAELDERSYREKLWSHRPLTDFWRVGRGYARKLEAHGLYTMGDVARCSIHNEDLLYKMFGINAELLIDHAWGWEPCTLADIKAYKPESKSVGSGQVLQQPYPFKKARLIIQEMADLLALELVEKGLVAEQIVLTVGYDRASLTNPKIASLYHGEVSTDYYGRKVPKHAHGTESLPRPTASTRLITEAALSIFDRTVNPLLLVRRVYLVANRVETAQAAEQRRGPVQLDMFSDPAVQEAEEAALAREKRMQEAILHIKKKYGKSAIFKGMDLQEGATTIARNQQLGGHRMGTEDDAEI